MDSQQQHLEYSPAACYKQVWLCTKDSSSTDGIYLCMVLTSV